MNKRVTRKRMLVLLLTLTMALSCLNVGGYGRYSGVVNAQELATATDSEMFVAETGENEGEEFQYENTYSSENFDVKFKLDNVWDTGYNATITITNTSDSVIENWCLTFPLNETISNIWNATVSEEHEDFYVVKNAGWNQDIAVGGSVSFGMTVYEPFTEFPEYYTIIGNQVETKSEDYTIDYKITEDWGDGYKAEITITNNKDTAIEDWRLSFEYGDNLITQIWNAVIVDNADDKYELSCENYNQNIAAGGSVSFGFMVEPGCSGKLMENVVLREYVFNGGNQDRDEDNNEDDEDKNDEEDKISDATAIIFGMLDEEDDKTLYLSMMASVDIERYEIYVSWDGKEYVKFGETQEAEYQYILENNFSCSEIYAVGYDENGKSVETNHIFIDNTDGVYAVILPDTDGDGLEDVYEIYYGSDINLPDTDEDGLSDYYEVYTSSTYPSLKDSDENGIMDGDEDYDEDGLSILEECNHNTDPLNPDTDYDNLLDGDEINVYSTNPLVADEDQDGLIDGDEIKVGTNPLNPDTDGDGILDGDEKFSQTYTYEVENKECVVKEISININGTGNVQSTTKVESIMDKDVLCSGVVGLVGEPFEITSESDFDKATIIFKINKKKLDSDVIFDNLMFLWYDEENDEFVELETKTNADLGWVMVDTTHFSKYMIVDKEEWYAAWAKELSYCSGQNDYEEYYTVLMVQSSWEMKYVDPRTSVKINSKDGVSFEYDCYRIGFVKNYVDNMIDNENLNVRIIGLGIPFKINFTNDKEFLKNQLNNIKDEYSDVIYPSDLEYAGENIVDETINKESVKKRVILIAVPHKGFADFSSVEKLYLKNDIQLDVITLGGEMKCDELIELCDKTGGHMYTIEDMGELSRLYYDIYFNNNINTTDSDGDKLYDVVERNGIRLKNGKVIYTDPYEADTDGDGLLDGEEIIPEIVFTPISLTLKKSSYRFYYNWKSDPTNPDSDGDGIGDAKDDFPKIKNYVEVVGLSNRQFVPIRYNNRTYYGGNQSWWSGEKNNVSNYGCGIIAMSNMELYINDCNEVYTYQEYKDYANKRMQEQYSLRKIPFGAYTLLTNVMEKGLKEKLQENNINSSVEWAKTYSSEHAKAMIEAMLRCDIPVVASYYKKEIIDDYIFFKEEKLKYYSLNENECKMNYAGKIGSHYFTITGIVEIYDGNRYVKYGRISTWGEEYYINLDEYTSRLSNFTNFLYTIY